MTVLMMSWNGWKIIRVSVAVDNGFDFTQLQNFGEIIHRNIHEWFSKKKAYISGRSYKK